MSAFNKTKLVTMSLWVVVLLWMVLIFSLSAQSAEQSNGLSEKVTKTIIKTIVWIVHVDIDAKTINGLVTQFHYLVRKFAHGWIYFMLGVLLIITFINTGITRFRAYVFAMVFCFFYAAMDEIHQTFVSGRSGQISDILIDTAGAFLGIGIYSVYNFLKLLNRNKS
jgi:VanZ family protein